MTWNETSPSLSAMLPNTRYFEVESQEVGAKFGVWVTTPSRYESEPDRRFAAIYQPDGNMSAPLTAPTMEMVRDDPINPVEPFINVSVGYVGADSERLLAVRARDLLPPGEPLLPTTNAETLSLLVEAGLLDAEAAALYLHNLQNPAADKFLAFLVNELHPMVTAEFRVDDASVGLFGYSYGGLFATYAALQRSIFYRVGAGSPGIAGSQSKVFDIYESARAGDSDYNGRMLHLTVSEREITAVSAYQAYVGIGTTEFITHAGKQPLRGLAVSSQFIPYESHASGFSSSWFSFLRQCYSVGSPGVSIMEQ